MLKTEPQRKDFIDAILAERNTLANLIECLTNDQWHSPSLCVGWSVGEVVYHLIFADKWRWIPLRDVLVGRGPFRFMHKWQHKEAKKGPTKAIAALRSENLAFTARWGLGIGACGNYAEQLIHVEDIRRPLGILRDKPPPEQLVWPALKLIGRWQRNRLTERGKVGMITPSKLSMTIDRKIILGTVLGPEHTPDALICGDPIELLLFITGRDANVNITGVGRLVDEINRKTLSFM